MYYFRLNRDTIEKYEITYDKEKLEDLNEEIIYNCSEIVHKEYESDYDPDLRDRKIKNYKYERVGTKEYDTEVRSVYRYSYDEYETPYLCELVKKILYKDDEHKLESIRMIFSSDLVEERASIDDRLEVLTNLFNNTKDTSAKQKYVNQINEILELKKQNPKVKPVAEYYDKVRDLIDINLVDTMPLTEAERFVEFFAKRIDVKYEKEDLLVLKKELKNM